MELDETDRRIVAALEADGRLPMVELAAKIGLSPTPCLRRVRRLEADGVIRGYRALIDPKAAGRGMQAFVMVTLRDHAEETVGAFHRALGERPEVAAAYAVSGDTDYLLHVMVPDLEAFNAFALKALLRMPGVSTTRSSFVMQELKPVQPAPGS